MATLAFVLLELGTIGCQAGVGREDLILAARVAADAAFEFSYAQEVARSALYLASDLSSFVTCTTLMVDGGMQG